MGILNDPCTGSVAYSLALFNFLNGGQCHPPFLFLDSLLARGLVSTWFSLNCENHPWLLLFKAKEARESRSRPVSWISRISLQRRLFSKAWMKREVKQLKTGMKSDPLKKRDNFTNRSNLDGNLNPNPNPNSLVEAV